jgi:ATP-binding cassette, subfamily B, bacterial
VHVLLSSEGAVPQVRAPAPDPGLVWWRRLLPFVHAHRRLLVGGLVSSVVGQALQVAAPAVLMAAIDDALVDRSSELLPYVFALLGIGAARLVVGMYQRHRAFALGADIEADLRVTVQSHLARLHQGFHDAVPTGQLVSRANSDVKLIQAFLVFAPLLAVSFAGMVAAVLVMLTIHVPLTLASLVTLPFVHLAGTRMRRRLFPVAWLVQARTAALTTIVEENLAGAHVVRGMAAESTQVRLLDRAADRLRWIAEREADLRSVHQPVIENLPRLGLALVVTYGGLLTIDGALTVGALVAFNAYLALLLFPFSFLGHVVLLAQRAAAATDRVLEVLDQEPAIISPATAVPLAEVRGRVRLEAVRFAYAGAPEVLRGVELEVEPGEVVAIVGRSGSGKSTLGRLLQRLYDVEAGRVLLDGRDVRDLDLSQLRRAVGVVSEDPFLFSGSIHDNIAYGRPDATRDEVVAAARVAAADEIVAGLPQGYDTPVGERGYRLSGGQRQRLAIARALLYRPAVLVLDDATSAVDTETEQRIFRGLRTELAGRTVLVSAHRLATIELADRVAVLDGGRIVATGRHEELLLTSRAYTEVLALGGTDPMVGRR